MWARGHPPTATDCGDGAFRCPPTNWAVGLPSVSKRLATFFCVFAIGLIAGTIFLSGSLPVLLCLTATFFAVLSGFSALWSP